MHTVSFQRIVYWVASYLHFRECGRWSVLATVLGVGIGLAAGEFQKGLDRAHEGEKSADDVAPPMRGTRVAERKRAGDQHIASALIGI